MTITTQQPKVSIENTTNEYGAKEVRKTTITNHIYKGVDYDLKVEEVKIKRTNGINTKYKLFSTRISYGQNYTSYKTKSDAIEMIKLIIEDHKEWGRL